VGNSPVAPTYGVQLVSRFGIVNAGKREKLGDGTTGRFRTFPKETYNVHDAPEMYNNELNEIRNKLLSGTFDFAAANRLTFARAQAKEHGENRGHAAMKCGCSSRKPGGCASNRCSCKKANRVCTRRCKCGNACCNR